MARDRYVSTLLVATGVLISLALGLGASLSQGVAYESPQPAMLAPTPTGPPPLIEEDLGPMPPKTEGHPKLLSPLAELASHYVAGGMVQAAAFAEARSIALVDGRARLVALVERGREEAVVRGIEELGGLVETRYGNEIQFLAPLPALQAIADLPGVSYVGQPHYLLPQAVTSEGVGVVGAEPWKAAGFKGKGVKVGIVDIGFQGYQGLLGSELPASVTARAFRSDGQIEGGTVHGAAVAEIIYDIAPEAELYFASHATIIEMGNAVDWLISQGVHIISASIGNACSAPGDGTGTSNEIVAKARQAGILWVNASGNEGERHWSGTFNDTDNDNIHNFTSSDEGNSVQLTAGTDIQICLKWDDWTQRTQDYDLYLFRGGNIVARSEGTQNGNLPPAEIINYKAPADETYAIVINKYNATRNVNFDLIISVSTLEYQVAAGSVVGSIPADSPNALTVGATYWKDDQLESYSSQGPTNDGRIKPDLTAPTGVSTQSYIGQGENEFHGTSSSTPHASGVAALVKSAFPSYSAAQLQSYLEAQALDLGQAGKDNQYGAGRLRLPAQAATPTPTRTPTPSPGVTPTPGPLTNTVYIPFLAKQYAEATATPTGTPTATPTATPTPPTPTPTATPTNTPTLLPSPGHWEGTTNLAYAVSFDVSADSTQWRLFKWTTSGLVGPCTYTITNTVSGPGTIVNGQFAYTGSDSSFSGRFASPVQATGSYAYTNHRVYGCGYFNQSGTWTATWLSGTGWVAEAGGYQKEYSEEEEGRPQVEGRPQQQLLEEDDPGQAGGSRSSGPPGARTGP